MRPALLMTVSLLAASPPVSAGPPAAVYTAEGLRARLLDAQRAIRSLRVVYRSYDYEGGQYPKGSYSHRVIVARSPHDLYHVSAHGHDHLDWRDDPLQQRATVTKDRIVNEFYVNSLFSEHALRPGEGLPGSLPNEFFFLATGVWPLDGREPPRPDGRPYMLREVAASADYSRVRPSLEEVDGRWCHVLEFPGHDRLWIDAERGCALLARETHLRRTGALVQRVELAGHREVAPGLWMPATMRNIQFDYNAATEEGRRRVYLDAMHTVLEVEVNRVDAGVFEFRARPGAMRSEGGGPLTQVTPGGVEHLDHLARWVRRQAPSAEADASVSPGSIMGGVVTLFIALCELWRRRAVGPTAARA